MSSVQTTLGNLQSKKGDVQGYMSTKLEIIEGRGHNGVTALRYGADLLLWLLSNFPRTKPYRVKWSHCHTWHVVYLPKMKPCHFTLL